MWCRVMGALIFVLGLLVVGCGRSQSQRVEPPNPADELRTALHQVAQTGEVGSTAMLIREKAEALKSSNPAVADAILQAVAELEKLDGKPEQAKAKAKEMLTKLGS